MAVIGLKGLLLGTRLRAFTPGPAPIHTQLLDFTAGSNRPRRLMGDASSTLGSMGLNKANGGFIVVGFVLFCALPDTRASLYHLAKS